MGGQVGRPALPPVSGIISGRFPSFTEMASSPIKGTWHRGSSEGVAMRLSRPLWVLSCLS